VNGNIALWIQQIKEHDYYGAWVTLTTNNPYPAIAGRICHHPCEPACNRGKYDESISICGLERFIGDMALAKGWSYQEVPIIRTEKIAIVGGGPAGLSAAFFLRRNGYPVTVFEAKSRLGGLLRYGIPPYRLSNDILDQETQRILDLGIEIRTEAAIKTAQDFEAMAAEYDVIYLATGADTPKRLPSLDYDKEWVIDGAEYLAQTNTGTTPDIGRRIVVIGGGSAAMDVARTARRHDRKITILSLEPEVHLPCQEEEVIESREEDIHIVDGAMLQSVTEKQHAGLLLNCIRINFIPGALRGQFSIEPVPGSEFVLEADTIVTSIGQDPDITHLDKILEINGTLVKIDGRQRTSRSGIFAGGDLASMERFVTHAIGMGKAAAGEIHSYLHPDEPVQDRKNINRYLQEDRTEATHELQNDVDIQVINTYYHDLLERRNQQMVPVAERLKNFAEVQLNFSLEDALHEAGRCFSCGNCIFCDNCFNYCPDMAIQKIDQGYAVKRDYCKGCGLCVKECPTGSIAMFEDRL
jgi:NADPH-dependent glutamate synthase beta subunit-like oxidoreductase